MIESLQGGYQIQGMTYASRTVNGRCTVNLTMPGDSASLSESGRLMSDFFSGLGVDYSGGAVSLDDLKAGLEKKQSTLEDDINTLFLQNGISISPPVELTTDAEGNVRVSGDHPQKKEIEALFADNPGLANDFRGVSLLSSLVEESEEYEAFAARYAQDPYAAVAEYAHLFSALPGDDGGFTMTIGETAPSSSRETAASAADEADSTASAGTSESTDAGSEPAARPDFTNLTRKELFDWMNGEIKSGRMTFEESSAFLGMTVKVSAATGQTVDLDEDTERCDFTAIARRGVEGALWRGDREAADRLQAALDTMEG